MNKAVFLQSVASLRGRITMLFIAAVAVLSSMTAGYWFYSLQPALMAEAESNATAFAQSQAQILADALSTTDGEIMRRDIMKAIDRMLLLMDSNTGTRFINGVALEVDYDVVHAAKGTLDISKGEIKCDICFVTEIPLYAKTTRELMGIATISSSGDFFRQLKKDMSNSVFVWIVVVSLLSVLSWATVVLLLKPLDTLAASLRRQQREGLSSLPELPGHTSEEIRLVKESLDSLLVNIRRRTEEIEKFKLLIDNSDDAHFLLTRDAKFQYVNKAACNMTGYSKDELLSLHVPDIDTVYDLPKFQELFDLIQKEKVHPVETINRRKDGSTFPSEIMVTGHEINEQQYMFASLRDITERRNTEARINAALKEKEVLLREIYHRTKNNMQVISSLLNLQSAQIEGPYRELFRDSQNRIRSMALVHEKLYQSADLARIDLSDYVKSLAKSLFETYGGSQGSVSLKTDMVRVSLGIDTVIPFGLIMNELISNSLKHAFPKGGEGEIVVELKESEVEGETVYDLTVSDNGIGMPEGLDIHNTETLGLRLVTTLVENQLQGELHLKQSEFHIRFREVRYEERR